MKTLILTMMILSSSLSFAATHTYKVETGDVGTIEITAKDKPTAFKQAAVECYDRRVAQYEAHRGSIDEDRALQFIESCANLSY